VTGTTHQLRRLALAAIASALAVSLAAAPPSAAKKKSAKLRVATASEVALGAQDPVAAVATCPKGTKVVSGGFATSTPALGSHWLNVHESQRISARAWRVSGVEIYAGSDKLTAYAYCDATTPKIKARSNTAVMPPIPGSGSVVQASCPEGTKALSGGFVSEPGTPTDLAMVSRSIRAGGTRWVVDATNVGAVPGGRNLTAQVYCAEVGKITKLFEDAAVVGPQGSLFTATTPKCPKKSTSRGGGFATSTPTGGLTNAAIVYESRRARFSRFGGATWSSSASAASATTSITLITDSYCR